MSDAATRDSPALLVLALLAIWCVGLFGRGLWTPDEPREADLAWRMSMQADKTVPLLAGEPFCEKPPLTYWIAGAAIAAFGFQPAVARLPQLLYALLSTLAIAALARRSLGRDAAPVAAAVMATFLLSYQVAIWLATDAPLLAFDSLALLGLWAGYHARSRGERLAGYALMHLALALGFLSKSATAWIVPALTLLTLALWERRVRELARIELYAPFLIEIALIGPWVWAVYRGADGPLHLRVFFWNNLAGRFVHLAAPAALEYAYGHRNSPGKYLIELPAYLWPWTLLVVAALRRAWQRRREDLRTVRFALASNVPAIFVLSLAATARNIYVAPTLAGFALLVAWWWHGLAHEADRGDARLVRATVVLLALTALGFAAATLLVGADAVHSLPPSYWILATLGLAATGALLVAAWRSAPQAALGAALGAWCVLLVAPALPLYGQIDRWQDLARLGSEIGGAAAGHRLILLAPDETTRALVDLYARSGGATEEGPGDDRAGRDGPAGRERGVDVIPAPLDAAALQRLDAELAADPGARVLVQLPGRQLTPTFATWAHRLGIAARAQGGSASGAPPPWQEDSHLLVLARFGLPNGRRYALLGASTALAGRGASGASQPVAGPSATVSAKTRSYSPI